MAHQMPWSSAITRRLKAWGWTQQQMADHLDLRPQRIHDWVHGVSTPSTSHQALLVERLSIHPDEVPPPWDDDRPAVPVPPAPTVEAVEATEGAA